MSKPEPSKPELFTCPHCAQVYEKRVRGRDPVTCSRCGRRIKKYPRVEARKP